MDIKADELFVISDLHMGGSGEGRIFDQGDRLVHLIQRIAKVSAKRSVALVLAGDVFDFLAHAGQVKATSRRYFFPEAERWLADLDNDDQVGPVLKALTDFLKNRLFTLVIMGGNHDVELHLPAVQRALRTRLDSRAGHLLFSTDGGGIRCEVGSSQVLCLHGDRADPANAVDQDRLRRMARAQRDGVPLPTWQPSPGTRLVMDVVNPIKDIHPFFDLFQPQDSRLLVLAGLVNPMLLRYVPEGLQMLRDRKAMHDQLELMSTSAGRVGRPAERMDVGAVLHGSTNYGPLNADGEDALDDDLLGVLDWIKGKFGLEGGRASMVRRLGSWLIDDAATRMDSPDELSEWVDEHVSAEVPFVVCGHTHIRKVIKRLDGRGGYFNTGTWIPILRLNKQDVETEEAIRSWVERLGRGDRASLGRLLRHEPTCAWFRVDQDCVKASLHEVNNDGQWSAALNDVEIIR